jgi:glycosyltransferase involved in cell wall biosynthesis
MTSKHIVIDARIRRSSTGRYADQLVEHLQDVDHFHRYTILVQPDDDWKMRAQNFTTLPCPFPQFSLNPLHELRFAWQLYRLKPDLVHFSMTQQPLLYFGRIVTTTHDLTMFKFAHPKGTPKPLFWLMMRLYHFQMWWSHKKSRRIIVPTRTTAKEVAAFQPFTENKLTVTYEAPGVPPNIKPKKPEGITGDFIMYLGTAFPHKNLHRLIEAFDTLHEKYPKLQLVLAGKREKYYEALEQWAKGRPSYPNIVFYGFMPDAEALWARRHCLAFVQPSLMEGFGIPVLESMAAGAPCVSSDASVMPEVYGDAAHYCNARDPKDIAEKTAEVIGHKKLREQLIKKGYEQVKKYSWHKMAEETLTVYKAALEE